MNPGLPIARQEPFLLYRSLFAVSPTEAKHRARAVHYFLVRSDRKVPVIAPRRGQGAGRASRVVGSASQQMVGQCCGFRMIGGGR